MSLQKLIEDVRKMANESVVDVRAKHDLLKLCEAAEVLQNHVELQKLSKPASDHDWIMAEKTLTMVSNICKE